MNRRVVIVSGNANNGSNAGLSYVNSNNSSSNANTNIGSQLSSKNNVIADHASWQKNTSQNHVLVEKSKTRERQSKMKRYGNLYEQIISIDNLRLADEKARKGKKKSYGVKLHDQNRESNILKLHRSLFDKTYKTSQYYIFQMTMDSGKVREIYRLPYYPDRICHHAVMNIMEPIWMKHFTSDTYSCIKGRGIHGAVNKIKKIMRTEQPVYCLKLDIKKFYPSIDHDVLKVLIRRLIKDNDLLWLLDEIIDSAPGVPIGNYLSQFFANYYLSQFDHWIKEVKCVRHYFRYCDDMVILGNDKIMLHNLRVEIQNYLASNLKLDIKSNYQVFPVQKRGLDFCGYVFYHDHTMLRKSIKKRFAQKVKNKPGDIRTTHSAYWGWAKHCNSKHLIKKLSA